MLYTDFVSRGAGSGTILNFENYDTSHVSDEFCIGMALVAVVCSLVVSRELESPTMI